MCQVILCDGGPCPMRIEIDPAIAQPDEQMLLPPWRIFQVTGWLGTFHACSDTCEQRVRNRCRVVS